MQSVVLDQFYQIVEADTRHVSLYWKVVHIGLFVGSAICGIITAYSFDQTLQAFDQNCILYAEVKFVPANEKREPLLMPTSNDTTWRPLVDQGLTKWGKKSYCNYTEFTPIMSFVISIIFCTFFLMVGRGGAGYDTDVFSRPWRIVVPAMMIVFIFLLFVLVGSVFLNDGLSKFCNNFDSIYSTVGCVPEIDEYTKDFNEFHKQYNFYTDTQIALHSSYSGVVVWLLQLLLLVLRVCSTVDFDVYITDIVQKEEEQLENVIEFHDEPTSSKDTTLEDVQEVADDVELDEKNTEKKVSLPQPDTHNTTEF